MGERNNTLYKVLIVIITISSCLLFFRTKLEQIIYPDNYIRSCSDYGQYFIEVKDYAKGNKLTDLMKVAEEPGFFLVTSSFIRITNISEKSVLSIFSMIMYCTTCYVLAILSTKIFYKIGNKYWVGCMAIFVFISFYGNINSQIAGIWRQIFGQMYILLVLLIAHYPNRKTVQLIGGIFVGMCIISHTFSMITVTGALILLALSGLVLKSQKGGLIKYTEILLIGTIVTLPYVYYVFIGYVYDYAVYLIKYLFGLSLKTANEVEGTTDYKIFMGEKNIGFNFFGTNTKHLAPILFYFINFSPIILTLVSGVRKTSVLLKNSLYKIFFLLMLVYVSMKIDFSARALLTFEVVSLPIILLAILKRDSWKLFKIVEIVGVFFLGFFLVGNGLVNKNFTKYSVNDDSITYMRKNFSDKKKVFFMGSNCTSDLMAELGVNSALNYHLNLSTARKDRADGKLSFTGVATVTNENIVFLNRAPVLFEFFRDKDIYIVFTERDWKILPQIQSGSYPLLNKPYIELVYSNNDKKASVKYIFHVKKNTVLYADNPNYLSENKDIAYE